MKSTQAPHGGFYESKASGILDYGEQSIVQDDSGDCIPGGEELYNFINYPQLHEAYMKEYVERWCLSFKEATGITIEPGTFEEMVSPREYNFGTDRTFMLISEETVMKMWDAVDKEALDKMIHDHFTSYDGFISHYDNSLAKWLTKDQNRWSNDDTPTVLTPLDWDHNQIGTLMACLWVDNTDEYDRDEHNIMEDGNSFIDGIIYDALHEKGKMLVTVCSEVRRGLSTYEDNLKWPELLERELGSDALDAVALAKDEKSLAEYKLKHETYMNVLVAHIDAAGREATKQLGYAQSRADRLKEENDKLKAELKALKEPKTEEAA